MTPTPDFAPILYWVTERECMRTAKAAGQPFLWTTDPILSTYRFCNVRREDDIGTIWIRKHIREPYADNRNLWLMLCIARQINWPETLQELMDEHVWPIDHFDAPGMARVLAARKARGDKLFTGAYVISAGSGGAKSEYIANTVIGDIFRSGPPPFVTLYTTHRWLSRHIGWGPFMAYQAVVDMRFTALLRDAPDTQTWAAAGPGTIRGLNRTFGRALKAPLLQSLALIEMQQVYQFLLENTTIPIDFSDIPNILCEVDKYLRGSSRTLYVPNRGA